MIDAGRTTSTCSQFFFLEINQIPVFALTLQSFTPPHVAYGDVPNFLSKFFRSICIFVSAMTTAEETPTGMIMDTEHDVIIPSPSTTNQPHTENKTIKEEIKAASMLKEKSESKKLGSVQVGDKSIEKLKVLKDELKADALPTATDEEQTTVAPKEQIGHGEYLIMI